MALFDEDVEETMSRSDAVDVMMETGSIAGDPAETPEPKAAPATEPATPAGPKDDTKAPAAEPKTVEPTEPAVADPVPVEPTVAAIEQQPLIIAAAGKRLAITGSYTDKDGNAFIPKQHVEALLRDAGRGLAADENYKALQRREAEVKRIRSEADGIVSEERVQAQAITQGLTELIQQIPELEASLAPAIQQLLLKAELAVERHKNTLALAANKPAPEVVAEQEREQKMTAVSHLLARDGPRAYPALFRTQQVSQDTLARVLERAPELVRLADGQLTPDDIATIDRQLEWMDRQVQSVLAAESAAKVAADAAKRNAAVTQTPAPSPARSVSAAGERKRDEKGRFEEAQDEDDEAAYRKSRRAAREAIMAADD